jgi:hypothetical protein
VTVVDVFSLIVINRSPEVVVAFVADPDSATSWYNNSESVTWNTAPPLGVGTRLTFVARFLGRRLEYTYEIAEWVPSRRLVMHTSDGPFAMETTYTWEPGPEGGTVMGLRNRGEPSGFSGMVAPAVASALRHANHRDLALLKDVVERATPL